MRNRSAGLFNVLTYLTLAATACLVVFYVLVGFNVVNPFSVSQQSIAEGIPGPSPTPTGPTPVATWTPTPTPTITPIPSPTNTRTPTPTPTITPTFPPTSSPTPSTTRAPFPFTYEVSMTTPQYGCGWTGVGGHVEDMDGNPLPGFPIHIWGGGFDLVVNSGQNPQHNTIYGVDSAWEQYYDASPKPMEVRVQLHDPYKADHLPISDEVVVKFPGYCSAALGYVVFTMNHEW